MALLLPRRVALGCLVSRSLAGAWIAGLLALLPGAAWADYIVRSQAMFASTIVEFYVTPGEVRVELEIGAGDIGAFRNLLPDGIYAEMGFGEQALAERLQIFANEDLVIRAGDSVLPVSLQRIEPAKRVSRDEISGEPLVAEEESEEIVLLATLHYAMEGEPAQLAFIPPLRYGPINIGFVAYHNGVAVNDFRYLGKPAVLDLDWADPWYSAFQTRSLRRAYYAPMSGFLYIEPFEVRKEIIVRPKDLQRWVDLGLEGLDTIPVELQGTVKEQVVAFLDQHLPTTIDGVPTEFELERVNFLRRTLRNSTVIDPPEPIPVDAAVMGVIYSAPTTGLPNKATMEWDLFDERIQVIPVAATDQAGPFPQFLEPRAPLLEWENFLKQPYIPSLQVLEPAPGALAVHALWLRWLLLAAVLALLVWLFTASRKRGALAPAPAIGAVVVSLLAAAAYWHSLGAARVAANPAPVVDALLQNIYHAFDFRQQEKVYDVLAASVEGDLLTDIYLETLRGLELSNQGGARAKVQSIELQDLQVEPLAAGEGFIARADWLVQGSVGHWGHVHQRVNRYQADLRIQPVAGQWKVTAMDVLAEERL